MQPRSNSGHEAIKAVQSEKLRLATWHIAADNCRASLQDEFLFDQTGTETEETTLVVPHKDKQSAPAVKQAENPPASGDVTDLATYRQQVANSFNQPPTEISHDQMAA